MADVAGVNIWASTLSEAQVQVAALVAVLRGGAPAGVGLPYAEPNASRDVPLFLLYTVALFLLNWGPRMLIVEPLVSRFLKAGTGLKTKFAQSAMESLFYTMSMAIGVRIVPSQDFIWPSSQWWEGYETGSHLMMRADLRCFYLCYAARYFQGILSVLLEKKRKDFVEMLVHHAVTVLLCQISFFYGWNRIGVVVMVLLDPADVPLHMAKLCVYLAQAADGWRGVFQFFADRLFEVFAVTFFVTRLVMFGYTCWSAHIEATRYFPKYLPEWTCVGLLYLLLVLQVYWFSLIARMALRLLLGNADGVSDLRSDDEDEGAPASGKAAGGKPHGKNKQQ